MAVAGALALSLVANLFSDRLNPYVLQIAILVGINIILAVSLNLINGYTGQFSLGHAGFMSVGAYTSAAITLNLGPKLFGPSGGAGWLATAVFFLCALLAAGVVAAAAGLVVGVPSLRLKGDYLAIVTLGFGEIIRVLVRNQDWLGGSLGLSGIPPYANLFWTFGFVAVTVYVVVSMVHSTYGRGFVAVHDDEVAAEAMGLNPTRYKITAFIVGAFFAGIAGGIYAHAVGFIEPRGFDFTKSIEIVVMVILGGMGNTTGVIIAAILLTLLPELPTLLPQSLQGIKDYRMMFYSLLLIILMLTRPQGLFTWKPALRSRGA
jgi:branched-chain amino acid transport system permease protein